MTIVTNPHTGQRARVFHRPGYVHSFRAKAPTDKFDYPTALVGKTPDGMVTIYYDPALGTNGQLTAAGLLGLAPNLVKQCEAW